MNPGMASRSQRIQHILTFEPGSRYTVFSQKHMVLCASHSLPSASTRAAKRAPHFLALRPELIDKIKIALGRSEADNGRSKKSGCRPFFWSHMRPKAAAASSDFDLKNNKSLPFRSGSLQIESTDVVAIAVFPNQIHSRGVPALFHVTYSGITHRYPLDESVSTIFKDFLKNSGRSLGERHPPPQAGEGSSIDCSMIGNRSRNTKFALDGWFRPLKLARRGGEGGILGRRFFQPH